jgi:hypothetical protein
VVFAPQRRIHFHVRVVGGDCRIGEHPVVRRDFAGDV